MTWGLVWAAVGGFGGAGVLVALAFFEKLPIVSPAIARWFSNRLERSLQAHQAELDQRLKHVQADIDRSLDLARATLSRETVDYGLWAAQRHQRTATLYGALLRWNDHARAAHFRSRDAVTTQDEKAVLVAAEAGRRLGSEASLKAKVDAILATIESRHQSYVFEELRRAREGADAAYQEHTLYLSDAVDTKARAVVESIGSLEVEYVLGDDDKFAEALVEAERLLRDLRRACRRDLGRAEYLDRESTASSEGTP